MGANITAVVIDVLEFGKSLDEADVITKFKSTVYLSVIREVQHQHRNCTDFVSITNICPNSSDICPCQQNISCNNR